MRFRAGIQNIHTFTKLTGSLAALHSIAWLRLNDHDVRFTVIPEQGTQVWAVLQIDTIFESYTIQSAADANTINLEIPLAPLHRALKSAQNASHASIRLTKKENIPLLSLTITTSIPSSGPTFASSSTLPRPSATDPSGRPPASAFPDDGASQFREESFDLGRADRETIITQDIPIRVLAPASVHGLHEPRCREPDVHILLPSLLQLKAISDRFTRLALTNSKGSAGAATPKLELAANMHGVLRLRLRTDAMNISSTWTGLTNPELDPGMVEGGEQGLATHPSTRMKEVGDAEGISEEGWAVVRVEGRDWGRVLGVGRLGGRVIACFCHEHALILYVYLAGEGEGDDESVLTYYVSSYSA